MLPPEYMAARTMLQPWPRQGKYFNTDEQEGDCARVCSFANVSVKPPGETVVVEPKYRPPTAAPDMNRKSPDPFKGNAGCWAVIAVVVVLVAVSRCSPTPTPGNSSDVATNTAQESLGSAITSQTTPPVEPLSKSSVRRGFEHLKLAMSSEGLGGEMIYSQNCYDALSRRFSWAKLDECGGADFEAIQLLGDADATGLEKETAWFENEAAAGRFLKAVTAGGQEAEAADARLNELQAVVKHADSARAAKVVKAALSDALPDPDEDGSPIGATNLTLDGGE